LILISLRPPLGLGPIFPDWYDCFNEIKAEKLAKSAFFRPLSVFAFRIAVLLSSGSLPEWTIPGLALRRVGVEATERAGTLTGSAIEVHAAIRRRAGY
jgi:hypothetical protein